MGASEDQEGRNPISVANGREIVPYSVAAPVRLDFCLLRLLSSLNRSWRELATLAVTEFQTNGCMNAFTHRGEKRNLNRSTDGHAKIGRAKRRRRRRY